MVKVRNSVTGVRADVSDRVAAFLGVEWVADDGKSVAETSVAETVKRKPGRPKKS